MDIIKRLPSNIAQYVFSFDDTYVNMYRIVVIQLMYYNWFNHEHISILNVYRSKFYTLNKKRKITNGIKTYIKRTNEQFDMDQINRFRQELPTLNMYRVPRHTKFSCYRFVCNIFEYGKFLSFQKYKCRSHHAEFGSSKYWYTNFMLLALILNGYRYRVNYNSENPEISINLKFTQSFYDTHRCQCTRKQIVERRWVQCN